MSKQTKEIKRLLKEIDETPIGPQERALIDQALVLAQEARDEKLEYGIRMRLTVSAHMTGDTETTLSSWSWCLGKHDSDPRRFPFKSGGGDLLWQYKWTAALLVRTPRFSLAQIEDVLGDMERRYSAAGVGLSGVWQARLANAVLMGRLDDALAARAAREKAGEDDYSHCEACVRSEDASLDEALGNAEGSLRLFDEIIEGNMTCGDEPENAQGNALLLLLRAGRLDDAVAHHRRGLRLAKANTEPFPLMAKHLIFCAVTGNEARGLALLERYLPELPEKSLDAVDQFRALVSYGVLLDAVQRSGHGDTIVRGTGEPALAAMLGLPGDGPVSATVMAAVSWAKAAELAAAFDARNGNDYYARQIAEARALAVEHYDLPLGGESFVADALPAQATPTDAAGWIDRGLEDLVIKEDPASALAAAGQAIDLNDPELTPRACSIAINALRALERADEAEEMQARRIAALRAQGDEPQARLEERLGLLMFGDFDEGSAEVLADELAKARAEGAPSSVVGDLGVTLASHLVQSDRLPEALTLLQDIVPLLAEQGPARLLEHGRILLSQALVRSGEFEQAAAVTDAVLAEPGLPVWRFVALRARIHIAWKLGQAAFALPLAEELLALAMATGHRPAIVDVASLSANLLSAVDRDAEAAARQQVAIRHAQLADLNVIGYTFMLGRYQQWSGQFAAAVDTFDEVLAAEEAAGAPASDLADTALALGHAAKGAEDWSRAYHAFGRAMAWADEAEAWERLRDAAFSRAELQAQFNDEDALPDFEVALDAAQKVGDPAAIRHIHHRRGRTRVGFGDQGGLDELAEALAMAKAEGNDWMVADIRDSQGRALLQLGRVGEGVAIQLEASGLYVAAGDRHAAAMAELSSARALNESDDPTAAASVYRTCLALLEPGTDAHSAVALEFGDVLEAIGNLAEAELVRATVQASPQG